MRRLNCSEVERDLWRYVDRELPASGVAAVSEHLKGCDACRRLYHDRARDVNLCRGVLATIALGPESSERIVKAMEREGMLHPPLWGDEKAADQLVGRLAPLGVPRGRLALAAACLIAGAVGLGWLLSRGSPAELGTFDADGVVERSSRPGTPVDRFTSGSCVSGDSFIVPGEVELTVRLESPGGSPGAILTVTGPAKLTIARTSTRREFSARLDSGVLEAQVEPRQATDGPFEIRTPEAVASVVGTAFVVDATVQGVTRLDVSHGAVDFRAVDAPVGQVAFRVTAATGARVVRRGDRMPVLPAAAPTPAVVSTEPADAARSARPPEAVPLDADPAVGEGDPVKIDSSVPVETPDRGAGSTAGPALDRPGLGETPGSGALDQVVNPPREGSSDDDPPDDE